MEFVLDFTPLASNKLFFGLANAAQYLYPSIKDEEQFRKVCEGVVALWKESKAAEFSFASDQFASHLRQISSGADNVIPTSWGGVCITDRDEPHVEKYLVVQAGKYLALEKHELKEETLCVREGCGVLMHRKKDTTALGVSVLEPGVTQFIAPGEEHCIVAFDNLLIFETSEDYKGMDRDLIFIFNPS